MREAEKHEGRSFIVVDRKGEFSPVVRGGERRAPQLPRDFGPEDLIALARSIIESEAGRQCRWSRSAVETVALIIAWEALKPEDRRK